MTDWLNRQPAGEEQQDGSVQPPDGGDAAGADDGDIMPLVDTDVDFPLTGWHVQKVSGSLTYTFTSSTIGTKQGSMSSSMYDVKYILSSTHLIAALPIYQYNHGSTLPSYQYINASVVAAGDLIVDFFLDVQLPANVENLTFHLSSWNAQTTELGRFSIQGGGNTGIVPSYYQLVVNGQPVGERVSYSQFFSQSSFYFDATTLGEPIQTIGYRMYYGNQSNTRSFQGGQNYVSGDLHLDANYTASSPLITYETGSTGLLTSIIEWLRKILDGITSIGKAIVALPGQIVNLLVDALKSLFIPSNDAMQAEFDKFKLLFEQRFGFVYQMSDFLVTTVKSFVSAFSSGSAYTFVFPGVSVNLSGEEYELIPSTQVDMDNALMAVITPVLGTIVSLVSVIMVYHKAEDLINAVLSGSTILEWHRGD